MWLPPDATTPETIAEGMRRVEQELQAQLIAGQHENVVSVIGLCHPPEISDGSGVGDLPWLVMKLMSGGTVLQLLRCVDVPGSGPAPLSPMCHPRTCSCAAAVIARVLARRRPDLPLSQRVRLAMQAANGIAHLHSHSMVHR